MHKQKNIIFEAIKPQEPYKPLLAEFIPKINNLKDGQSKVFKFKRFI